MIIPWNFKAKNTRGNLLPIKAMRFHLHLHQNLATVSQSRTNIQQ